MVNAALRGPAQGNRHVEGADRQVFLHPVADGPSDHPAGMQVQDDSQIDPAFARPDIGDVAGPFLVGLARSEILLQEIWRDVECVIAVSRRKSRSGASDTPPGGAQHASPTRSILPSFGANHSCPGSVCAARGYAPKAPCRAAADAIQAMLPSPKATIRDPHHAAGMCPLK